MTEMMEPALQLAQKIRGRLSALAPRLVLRADAGAELLFDSGRHSLRILLYGDTATVCFAREEANFDAADLDALAEYTQAFLANQRVAVACESAAGRPLFSGVCPPEALDLSGRAIASSLPGTRPPRRLRVWVASYSGRYDAELTYVRHADAYRLA